MKCIWPGKQNSTWASIDGSVVKSLPTSAGDTVPGSGRSLEKEMATHSSIPAWEISWTEEPGRLCCACVRASPCQAQGTGTQWWLVGSCWDKCHHLSGLLKPRDWPENGLSLWLGCVEGIADSTMRWFLNFTLGGWLFQSSPSILGAPCSDDICDTSNYKNDLVPRGGQLFEDTVLKSELIPKVGKIRLI